MTRPALVAFRSFWGQVREAGMIPHYSISEETKEVGLEAGLFFYLS